MKISSQESGLKKKIKRHDFSKWSWQSRTKFWCNWPIISSSNPHSPPRLQTNQDNRVWHIYKDRKIFLKCDNWCWWYTSEIATEFHKWILFHSPTILISNKIFNKTILTAFAESEENPKLFIWLFEKFTFSVIIIYI